MLHFLTSAVKATHFNSLALLSSQKLTRPPCW